MAKKKTPPPVAENQPPAQPVAGRPNFDGLMQLVEKDAKRKSTFYRASSVGSDWRYIDFIDLAKKRPCLPLEWLYGTRGFLTGRVVKYSSNEAAGKSSVLLMNVGMAQATGGVWPCIWETEKAVPPPDYIHSLGCDPKTLLLQAPDTVKECLKGIPAFIKTIRGKNVDPDKEFPILLGIDSVSGLGANAVDIEEGDKKSEDSLGFHARQFSKFFREQFKLCAREDAILFATAQVKANIETGGMPGAKPRGGSKKTTSIADAPFAYHASWIIKLYHKRAVNPTDGTVEGELVTMLSEKNKLAPHQRLINVLMRKHSLAEDEPVWSFSQATVGLLFGPSSPFDQEKCQSGGGWYRHDALGGSNYRLEDFVDAFYSNEELLMEVREKLRIRGFGFKFETDYANEEALSDADTP